MPKHLLISIMFCVYSLAQSNVGELRLKVVGPSGVAIRSRVELLSDANHYHNIFSTDEAGDLIARHLPYGVYQLEIHEPDFAPISQTIEIRSAIPLIYTVKLNLPSVATSVTVTAGATLIDPYRAGSLNQIGPDSIENRATSLPGRSLQDLVNSQPGWLYEGNAVLHPRGSEYQTQFLIDGIPLTDNRSPGFGPEIEADDVESVDVYTAGIPAEYGRKMGGIVELTTQRDPQQGLHGDFALSGGSFDTAGAFTRIQYATGKNSFLASANGDMTGHYLNPVVPENFTNQGTTGDFSAGYERELTAHDRLNFIVRHALSRFDIPNELVQQQAGQRQTADNFETMGIVSYQHMFSPHIIADLRGMVRDAYNDLFSNVDSTPIIAFQHNNFTEGYFKGTISIDRGRQEWKAGLESDNLSLNESFTDFITNPPRFQPGTPPAFAFTGHHLDLEQSAFLQDLMRLGKWTVSAGLRWDHYQLLLNQNAVSPRLSVSRYFRSADMVLHASYDRVFQTPAFENILLSSSPHVLSLNPSVLRLPVKPSHGNYYEVGLTKGFLGKLRLDANYFRRDVNNFADDDTILNTVVAFPIAFNHAIIYGAEAKLEVPLWSRFSGFVSYSYQVGSAWFPVTGGLFLGDDAVSASNQLTGHFPDSQDQRNTIRARVRSQLNSRVWIAGGVQYGSGLPFAFTGTYQQALAQYGPAVVNELNFARDRIQPVLSFDASVGTNLYQKDKVALRLQADVENLTNRLNVIDFNGLFSFNAIGPPRSYELRLTTVF
ncbi:MAG: TonB-dependent receptor [Acidobacteriaceae bacterium]|nr:TonB-dependent receptor [Acidobacteriaceae bacterium]